MKRFIKEYIFWINLVLKLIMLSEDAQGNIDLFVSKEKIRVSQNQLLKTFNIFPKTFEVKFEACLFSPAYSSENTYDKNWLNFFSLEKISEDITLTTIYQTRTTFISLWLSSLNNTNFPSLTVDAEISGKLQLSYAKKKPFSFDCTQFNIVQHLIDGYYNFSISVNGSNIGTSGNIIEKEMSNIEMYVSSFRYNAQPGYIKNLTVTKLCLENNCKPQLNFTYKLTRIIKLGCWLDNSERTLINLEGTSVLDGDYKDRIDPFGKCYKVAAERGYKYFALQYSGYCSAGNNESYKKLGKSSKCQPNGEGGPWANEVYTDNQSEFKNGIDFRYFLYITLNISYWNLDEPAVNVTWEYLLPPFIKFQSTYSSENSVFSNSNNLVYKIMKLPDIGVSQSITAFIDNSSCLYCGNYISIPIKFYFENTAGLSYKSFQTKPFEINCYSQNDQQQFSDLNECIKPCNWTLSVCINGEDCYNCICGSGWKLADNNYSCIDINECLDSDNYCNWENSDCINTNGSYNCSCKTGWRLNEYNNSCVDIDECINLTKYCHWTNSDCINTNGSYSCTCKPGWRWDEFNNSCVDIDECANLTEYCSWSNSDCINTNGSYNCTCKFGWTLDEYNESCVDIDECIYLTKYCNWMNSDCINYNGSYYCTCKPGWILDEYKNCVDIDECSSSSNICNTTNNVCVNSIGSYSCYKGEWSTWSECSETCGFGYKYSILNTPLISQQETMQSLPCMNIKCPVDGTWSDWINYSSCSDSCGICFIKQERYCNNPLPTDGGHVCFGINVQYADSNSICRVNGGWTQWSSWSLCSQPCQDGIKKRYRSCTNPVPKYGGLQCNGINTDESICYSNECKQVIVNFGMILSDIDYITQYSSPLSEPYEELEKITKTMFQNLYNKFNKTVQCTLNSIKNEKDYQKKP
ncbi:uncharacterized protein LOC105843590 isoform X2 [Hydra vulgaris]|uniref:uncharacterized protein LOC105843590 isoform X2 n=1 Tax=Hydra vulgaris TaxID=6087 RepID=UPI001F5FCDF3|nr:uncharacterized protein LOC105843590 isoform X2 [Hydra vulgaris]